MPFTSHSALDGKRPLGSVQALFRSCSRTPSATTRSPVCAARAEWNLHPSTIRITASSRTTGRRSYSQTMSRPMDSNQSKPAQALDQGSEWFSYRCRLCDHSEWVEDIVAYAFPPEIPGETAVVMGCSHARHRFCRSIWRIASEFRVELSMPSIDRGQIGLTAPCFHR